jgi:condensin complex subunit 1
MKIHLALDYLFQLHQILEEHKLQGEEDQALEKRVGKKKAAAKKRAARKSKMHEPLCPIL